jgi:diaminohydroxyphosphoribosylaminopyrimidine deaminase / 5-amino-6-(5-phosphoribosylamino)uracil reductase
MTRAERAYLARACELAQRGVGSTSPNPPVGAVIVRGGETLGEGFHRVRGGPHAEVEALQDARARGHDVRGATAIVSLEPCDHHGVTGPCTEAVLEAGVARVVIGTADPNPKTAGAGIARLHRAGVEVEIADDEWAHALIAPFAVAIRSPRPYVTLKMAASLDGYVAPQPGSCWLTSRPSRERVRELRWMHDAVMVGAGTIRVDDPQLTVRPLRARRRAYVRVVACEDEPVPARARVFAAEDGYAKTIVLAPAGRRDHFRPLEAVADCHYVGDREARDLDLEAALSALKGAGISSVLCEGGPTLASALLAESLVDQLVWFVAPVLLRNERAIPVLRDDVTAGIAGWRFDSVERSGDDLLLTANLRSDV